MPPLWPTGGAELPPDGAGGESSLSAAMPAPDPPRSRRTGRNRRKGRRVGSPPRKLRSATPFHPRLPSSPSSASRSTHKRAQIPVVWCGPRAPPTIPSPSAARRSGHDQTGSHMFRPASRTRENWPLAVPILAAVAVWAVVTALPCASVRSLAGICDGPPPSPPRRILILSPASTTSMTAERCV